MSNRRGYRSWRRDPFEVTKSLVDLHPMFNSLFEVPRSRLRLLRLPLASVEDRRLYNPAPFTARDFSGRPHQLVVSPSLRARRSRSARQTRGVVRRAPLPIFSVPKKIGFKNASRVLLCVRRNRRREVMFAKHVAGSGTQRPPRRNWFSEIVC